MGSGRLTGPELVLPDGGRYRAGDEVVALTPSAEGALVMSSVPRWKLSSRTRARCPLRTTDDQLVHLGAEEAAADRLGYAYVTTVTNATQTFFGRHAVLGACHWAPARLGLSRVRRGRAPSGAPSVETGAGCSGRRGSSRGMRRWMSTSQPLTCTRSTSRRMSLWRWWKSRSSKPASTREAKPSRRWRSRFPLVSSRRWASSWSRWCLDRSSP